ncbi:protein kinase [Pseudoalteromonas sp.]|uniref:protein kinase domain-containing protein n=1 Tax=Pseudoalteromonas sp. TaxID=53249 RepID=UPI003564CFD9
MSQLKVTIASSCNQGIKLINEDAIESHVPEHQHSIQYKGITAVLADGVSTAEAGKEASHYAVTQFIADYYQTPDTWSVGQCGQKILTSINLNLYKKSHAFHTELKGFLSTFSGVIIKSMTAHLFHVGDSRIYHIRADDITQLSQDHVAFMGEKSSLARALGMDNNLTIDYRKHALEEGDYLVLTSDGVHDFLDPKIWPHYFAKHPDFQQSAEQLISLALENGSDDNLSCIVIRIDQLPKQTLDDYNTKLTRLPFPPALEPGYQLDGFTIKKELFASSRSQLYLVTDNHTGVELVMKTPSINFEDDTHYIDRFIQEEWIGLRIDSDYVVKVIKQNRQRSCLYYLMEYIDGVGLDDWIIKNRDAKASVKFSLIEQIGQGLMAFHSKETVHQDLKPGNILVMPNNQIKIVDFGSVFVAGVAEIYSPIKHQGALGTATYSDPNYLFGKNTGVQGDVYALATICYETFSLALPYGNEIEECQSRFDFDRLRYTSITEHNPMIPIWFDRALEKGVRFDPLERYGTIENLLADLREPNAKFLLDDPKIHKDSSKLLFWQILSGFWVLMLIIVIILFSQK